MQNSENDVTFKIEKFGISRTAWRFFVLAFESVACRVKCTVLIFCFVLHQGKMKNKPKGCVRKTDRIISTTDRHE